MPAREGKISYEHCFYFANFSQWRRIHSVADRDRAVNPHVATIEAPIADPWVARTKSFGRGFRGKSSNSRSSSFSTSSISGLPRSSVSIHRWPRARCLIEIPQKSIGIDEQEMQSHQLSTSAAQTAHFPIYDADMVGRWRIIGTDPFSGGPAVAMLARCTYGNSVGWIGSYISASKQAPATSNSMSALARPY